MKKLMSILFAAILLVSPFSSASANEGQALSRGQFFKMVVDHLGYDASNSKVELPKDISADSPYAAAAKVLKDKKIVAGYGDGTFKPNQNITPAEVSSIVARFLAIKGDAKAALASNYGISFDNNSVVTVEKAQEVIAKALTSDKSALELVDKTTAAQNQQNSFQANGNMSMQFSLKKGTPEIPDMPDGMKMDTSIEMSFNKEKGMKQLVTTKVPNPATNELQEMTIEQYFVPEGIFMKMPDPTTGKDQWLDMSAVMPFSFKDLMKMNEEHMNVINGLDRQYFFYRDLGKENLNGTSYSKIGISGKINSIQEILNVMGSALNDQSNALLSGIESMPNMEVAMNGIMLVDEKTLLPARQTMQFEIKFGASKNPAMEMPFESIHYVMDLSYSNFNQVTEIVLPEAAKTAEKMPGLEEATQQPASIEQK